MTTESQFDTCPEVIPANSDNHLPQVYSPPIDQVGWSHSPCYNYPSSANDAPSDHHHASQYYQPVSTVFLKDESDRQTRSGASPATDDMRNKPAVQRCSNLVVALVVTLIVAFAAVIGLAAATGVALKNKHDANSELKALRASFASYTDAPTATASTAFPSSTSGESSDIANGCSAKKDTVSGTTYTSDFYNNAQFTMYCNTNAPNKPIFSVFAGNFHGCIEACNIWNNYNITKEQTCEGVSFVPFWADLDNAAGNNAPGDCYLKPGPQSKSKLDDARDTHAALLRQ